MKGKFCVICRMNWEVDGQHIAIRLKESGNIEIIQWDASRKIVSVPAGLSKSEAMWCLRNLLRKRNKDLLTFPDRQLHIFDRLWPVIPLGKSKKTFIKNGAIYAYVSGPSLAATQERTIRGDLLEQKIAELLGKWEDFFGHMVSNVKLRKNDKRPFTVSLEKQTVTFDRGLERFSLEQIDYCVFCACSEYFSLEAMVVDRVSRNTFPSTKLFEKIFAHEYKNYVKD